ncbi:MAG: diacylglycerol/lipid kinase family protein [Halanaerobiales bacterium]
MKQQGRISSMPLEKKRVLAIVNPAAGGGRTGKKWPDYEKVFKKYELEIEVVYTRRAGHAPLLTREALKQGYTRIMSVGGDGTVNEVVNGFFERGELVNPDSALIVFGSGTGSDLGRSLNIKRNPETVLKIIERGSKTFIDLGRVTYVSNKQKKEKYFINLSDAGLGGATVARIDRASKRLGGLLGYLLAALKTLVKYENKYFSLIIDGRKIKSECLNSIIVANGAYFAGGMEIAPGADLKSGLLDVVVIGDLSKGEIVTNLYKAYSGKHLSHPGVEVYRGKKIEIKSTEKVYLNIDGEAAGRLPAVFEVLPQKMPVLVM